MSDSTRISSPFSSKPKPDLPLTTTDSSTKIYTIWILEDRLRRRHLHGEVLQHQVPLQQTHSSDMHSTCTYAVLLSAVQQIAWLLLRYAGDVFGVGFTNLREVREDDILCLT